jgi:hypothetical protein
LEHGNALGLVEHMGLHHKMDIHRYIMNIYICVIHIYADIIIVYIYIYIHLNVKYTYIYIYVCMYKHYIYICICVYIYDMTYERHCI